MEDLPLQVLSSSAKKICVIAAPGAGKTSAILLPKVKSILEREDISSDEVLLLTFSRMSANDLKNKVKSIGKSPKASTVHSYCLSFLLSENNHSIRQRVDNIVLDFEKQVLISDLKQTFPDVHKNILESLLKEFSAAWATKQHEELFNEDMQRKSFKSAIINWLVEHEAAMMEEIIYHAVNLAKQVSDSKLIEYPKYIFVDEFQDLNKLEQEFIDLLAKNSEFLLVVGDPDQSIYSFKFAHREGINTFGARETVELYQWNVSKRCPKKVLNIANQLLKQAEPNRSDFVAPLTDAIEGEVRFIKKDLQPDEFSSVIEDVGAKLLLGASPNSFLILVPKKKLGKEFVDFANTQREHYSIPDNIKFVFTEKLEFTTLEQERILLFALLVNPKSILHFRSYLGIGDSSNFSKELKELKDKYGNLSLVFTNANSEDFGTKKHRIRTLCRKIQELRSFVESHPEPQDVETILGEIFPEDVVAYHSIRQTIYDLREEDDTLSSLYLKFLDHIKAVPTIPNTISIMTIMASKGLDADHVYVIGCNSGNIPGENRSPYMSDLEHRNEQLRLLFVGVTRSKKTLQISWSRSLPFGQAQGHHTSSIATVKKNGVLYSQVGLCEFLQSITDIHWES